MNIGTRLLVICVMGAASTAALAQVDNKCLQRWHQAVAARALGERCQSMDAATLAKLKALEDSSLACAGTKANAADKAALTANTAKMKDGMVRELSLEPCNDTAKTTSADQAKVLLK